MQSDSSNTLTSLGFVHCFRIHFNNISDTAVATHTPKLNGIKFQDSF